MSFGLALTLGGTATYNKLTGRPMLPRRSLFAGLAAGLVADGISFARGLFRAERAGWRCRWQPPLCCNGGGGHSCS
jgi:hypothetical protein